MLYLCGGSLRTDPIFQSTNNDEAIFLYVVLYWMGEGYSYTIADDRDIDASPLELVNECLIMIGTHT